jgi:murein DD-endopeptidase MepM/ murein hydrolase activator NlpD
MTLASRGWPTIMSASEDDIGSFDPRAWGAVAAVPAPEVKKDVPPPPAKARKPIGGVLPYALSALVLAGGLGAATAMRAPSVPVHEKTAAALPTEVAANGSAAATEAVVQTSRRVLNLKGSGELREALVANGIDAAQSEAAARAGLAILGGAGGELRAEMMITGSKPAKLQRLALSFADSSGAVVEQAADGSFAGRKVAAQLSTVIFVRRGQMGDDNFYTSAVAAGVTDSLISDFANAFVYDFNFQTEIRAGDVFEAAFEQNLNATGQTVGAPRLLYASMATSDKSKQLYRYQAPGEEAGWFDGNGRSIKRSFMRTPVEGARITSKFGPRFHPVLHYTRLHGGTDFAAPVGTPIYAAANGVITSASPSTCAGNMVIMKHDNGWETRYFHLSRYADGLVAGLRVNQGFTVGFVGNTGTCTTGPHLHYEVHINGEKVDPQSIPTEAGVALSGDGLKAFLKERDRIDVARARYTG